MTKRNSANVRSRLWHRIRHDEGGAVLVYVSILLPVLIGLSLLAVDASRFYNMASSLQKGADALALAGAAELDRKPNSITRATAAINSMVTNQHKFAVASPATIATSGIRFLKSLPANDQDPIGTANVTADPVLARFVEVTVQTQTLNTIMPAGFLGLSNTLTASAKAVAGFDAAVCKFTPMFICNPWEGTGTTLLEALGDTAQRKRMLDLRPPAASQSQYAPGNFGFLDPPSGSGHGASDLRQMFAQANPPACFIQNGVQPKPGLINSVGQAINVRFDDYKGSFKKDNPDYPPASNVRKGYKGNGCGANPPGTPDPTKWDGLTKDTCFATSSCTGANGRMGDGQWDFDTYWATNHTVGGSLRPKPTCNGTPCSNANTPARADVYHYEIDNGWIGDNSKGSPSENGTPLCYNGTGSKTPDRRNLYITVIDCIENPIANGASGPPVPVAAFAKFFVTEPVAGGSNPDIYGELVGVVEPGTVANDVAHDIVQLYR